VDYAINERLAALDLVGIHELFREVRAFQAQSRERSLKVH
jgi:hypothetical protein